MQLKKSAAFAAALFASGLCVAAHASTFTLKIIGFNDYHGNMAPPSGTTRAPSMTTPGATVNVPTGGVAYLSTLLQQLRAQNPVNITVAAGDLIGATPLVSALFHDEAAIETLNALGVDFASVGNHEFDKGTKELKRMQNGGCYPGGTIGVDTCIINSTFTGASFKYLAANVINDAKGKPLFPAYRVRYVTNPADGKKVKVAFIGLVLEGTPSIVTPSGVAGLTFKDEAATVNALVPELKGKGVNAIVVVIHQGGTTTGLYDDQSCPGLSGDIVGIVNQLDPAVDLVISGHTHQAYVCSAKAADGVKDIKLTSAGFYGRMLTDINVTLDTASKDITAVDAHNVLVVNDVAPVPTGYTALAKDANEQSIIDTYSTLAAPLANAKIGSITADITRTATITTTSGNGESALGDVIADAQLAATSPAGFGEAQVAFMNPGGIRADFLYNTAYYAGEPAGDIAYGEAFNVQPFYNSLVTMTLTGQQIKDLLEQQFDNPSTGQTRIMQVSNGFEYTWDYSQPHGSHVIQSSIKIGGVVVDPAASYRVTCNSFMATGGDNFTVFNSGTDRLGGALDIDALKAYFQVNSPVGPGAKTRITRVTSGS